MNTAYFDTPVGSMCATADEEALLSLEFVEKKSVSERNALLQSIENELQMYFRGELRQFSTPIKLVGTPFQIEVWNALSTIPFGTTWSYKELALSINNPKAVRAVAQANGANRFVILVPCHRVINTGGGLGGYSAGLERKKWLLAHEG